MSAPLRISFEVDCSDRQAFHLWTAQIGTWWPRDHSVSGEPTCDVVIESGHGGRIYERGSGGVEHEWGRVRLWDPPVRLGYSWYLGRSPAEATDVEVSFIALSETRTLVEIEHRGWERLGATADVWRDRNRVGWQTLLPHFATAISAQTGGW